MPWLAENWGNLASAAGLAISVATFVLAGKAKTAAEAAKSAVERRSLSQDLRDSAEDIAAVMLFTDGQRFDLAAHSCYGVITDLNFLTSRWTAHLDGKSRQQLAASVGQLEIINVQLRKFRQSTPTATELGLLSDSILKVNNILAGEVGKYEAQQ